jgi:hypothetical protein
MSDFTTCENAKKATVSVFGRAGTAPGNCPYHVAGVIPLENAIRKALKTRYGQVLTKTGIIWTYACRDVRGGDDHSEHSHPLAADFNPPTNPLRDDGEFICDFDRFGAEDGAAFVNAFTSEGFKWGGNGYSTAKIDADFFRKARANNTRRRVDCMHFEWDGPVVQKAQVRRYVKAAPRRAWNRVRRTVHLSSPTNRRLLRIARAEWEQKVEKE